MPFAEKPITWVNRAAKDLRPGDCDHFGTADDQYQYRTVSHVTFVGNGLVEVRHVETLDTHFDQYGETHLVKVAKEQPTDRRHAERIRRARENMENPRRPEDTA